MSRPISLSVFGQIYNTTGTGVVQFEKGSTTQLKSGGTYRAWNLLGRGIFRFGSNKKANNAIRTELLRSLAVAFKLGDPKHELELTEEIVNQLKQKLGANVLCGNDGNVFKVRNGKVVSGSPLTERRIMAILTKVKQELGNAQIGDCYESVPQTSTDKGQEVLQTKTVTLGEALKNQEICEGDRIAAKEKSEIRRAMLHFTGVVSAVCRLKPEEIKPNTKWAVFPTIGDAMRISGHEPPDLLDVYRGLSAVLKKADGGDPWETCGKGALDAFSDHVLELLKPFSESDHAPDTKDSVKTFFKKILSDVEAGSFADADAFLKAISSRFNELKLPGKLRLTVDQARYVLATALDPIVEEIRGRGSENILRKAGGKFQQEMRFVFTRMFGGVTKSFKSTVSPVDSKLNPSKDVEYGEYSVSPDNAQNCKIRPVTNLMVSKLSVDGEGGDEQTLVSFVRFGQVGSSNEYQPRFLGWGHEVSKEEELDEAMRADVARQKQTAAYQTLARTILMNNEVLLEKARTDGVVDVPIYRVDMCSFDENNLTLPGEEKIDAFEIDLGGGVIAKIQPQVHHFFSPVDSKPEWTNFDDKRFQTFMTQSQLARTSDELDKLLARAQDAVEDPKLPIGDQTKEKIRKLCRSLEAFGKDYLSPEKAETVFKEESGQYWTIGKVSARFLQFGAQVAMLASLLGQTPAINCNWGRDRTSLMDSEIKMLATKLEYDPDADLTIDERAVDDEGEKKIRSEFVRDTGNGEIARQMNISTGTISLHQGGNISESFDADVVNELPNEIIAS